MQFNLWLIWWYAGTTKRTFGAVDWNSKHSIASWKLPHHSWTIFGKLQLPRPQAAVQLSILLWPDTRQWTVCTICASFFFARKLCSMYSSIKLIVILTLPIRIAWNGEFCFGSTYYISHGISSVDFLRAAHEMENEQFLAEKKNVENANCRRTFGWWPDYYLLSTFVSANTKTNLFTYDSIHQAPAGLRGRQRGSREKM